MTSFQPPVRAIGPLDGEAVARLLVAAADIAVVLDRSGIVRDIAFGPNDLPQLGLADWLGRPFVETVSSEGRHKIQELLAAAAQDGVGRSREVTHGLRAGQDLPMRYAVARAGADGRLIALGHDLRPISRLQQRLVDQQMALDAENARFRQSDTRFRLVYQHAVDAMLFVDAAGPRIVDANPSALALLGATAGGTVGQSPAALFREADHAALVEHLATARATGRAAPVVLHLAADGRAVTIAATLFRQGKGVQFLLRLSGPEDAAPSAPQPAGGLMAAVRMLPEAMVITDRNLIVQEVNAAFLAMTAIGSEEQVRGHALTRWLGRPGVDINVLLGNLRDHGVVRDFATRLRGEHGGDEEVEVTAVGLAEGGPAQSAFLIRRADPILKGGADTRRELPHSVERMTELVGRVPLKELVRDTTDVIERLCIETALRMTGDNRASAAQMLGLSRQSLYAKLRRYGFDAGDEDSDEPEA